MSNKGYLLIANNNANNDYVKQAIFCAQRIKKFCNNAPVSVITSDGDYLRHNDNASVFDNIIDINYQGINNRIIFDGALSHKTVNWKNVGRHLAYELTPYDETILLDTDYIFCNNSAIINPNTK